MSLGKRHSIALGAGDSVKWPGGRFFKLIQAAADVTVEFFTADGEPLGEFVNVRAGLKFSLEPADIGKVARLTGFGSVKITSATAQTVSAIISRQEIDYDSVAATVSFEKATTLTESVDLAVVDAAAAVVALAANSSRRTAIIGNLATNTGPVRVGVAPDNTHGLEVQPGMAVYLDTTAEIKVFAPTAGGNQTITRHEVSD